MTANTHFSKLADLVLQARALPAEERDEFLKSECGEVPELYAAAVRLAHIPAANAELLERFNPYESLSEHMRLKPGAIFGKYRIVKELAVGGMSTVYLAEQTHNRQPVAVKFLNPESVRFSPNEHEILGTLKHENIARLSYSDVTEDGIPYLVLEHVDGEPLSQYCQSHNLSLDDRLKLFLSICKGIQYAHSVPVAHRDLKPGNILVGKDQTPKILDFGLARTLPKDIRDATQTHGQGQPMTLLFASPEQVLGERTGIPSDIYSLGVILCVLLTGRLPYRVRGQGELYTAIPTQEPTRPSTLLEAPQIAKPGEPHYPYLGPTPPPEDMQRLKKRITGDLDAIVLKALRKEPEKRYQTVGEFASDVDNFLNDRPVSAHKGGSLYRAVKFVKRRTGTVAALLVIALLLVGSAALLLLEQRRTREQQQRAVRLNQFLLEIFSRLDPAESREDTVTARELLGHAAQTLRVRQDLAPSDRAQLLASLSEAYLSLGLYEDLIQILKPSIRQIENIATTDPETAHHLLINLSSAYFYRYNLQEAEQFALQSEELASTAMENAPLPLAQALHMRAIIRWKQGSFSEADKLYQRALKLKESLGPEHRETLASTLSGLGVLLLDMGEYERAEAILRETLSIRERTLAEGHPDTAEAIFNLGLLRHHQGKYADAHSAYIKALTFYQDIFGDRHPRICNVLTTVGALEHAEGKPKEAEVRLRRAVVVCSQTLGADSQAAASAMNNLAALLRDQGQYAEAEQFYSKVLAIDQRIFGDHPRTANTLANIGTLFGDVGKNDESLELHRRAVAMLRRTVGDQHPETGRKLIGLANALKRLERLDEAEAALKESLAISRAVLSPQHLDVIVAENNLASLLRDRGKIGEAKQLLIGCIAKAEATLGPTHRHVATFRVNLARILNMEGNYKEARHEAEDARQLYKTTLPADHVLIAKADGAVGESLCGLRQFQEAEPLLTKSFIRIREVEGNSSPGTRLALERLTRLYEAWGKQDKAAQYRKLLEAVGR